MDDPAFLQELFKLLGRWGHVFISLAEGDYGKSHPLQILGHLHGSPSVERDLKDVVLCPQLPDELFDKSVVDHISLRRHQISLLFPHIVGDGCPPHPQRNRILRHPEEREHDIFLILCPRREHQHKGCDVTGAGKVKAGVAVPAKKGIHIDWKVAQVVNLFRNEPGQA